MNDKGYDYNEAYFASQGTNRHYAGPLDMPWLDEGMAIAQWNNGIISSPLDDLNIFYHPNTIKNGEYPACLCFWKIKRLKTSPKVNNNTK